jgi:hypothetical protein
MLAGKRVVITCGRGKDQASRGHDLQDLEGRIKTIFEFSKKSVNTTTFPVTAEDDRETDQKVGEYLHSSKSPIFDVVIMVELSPACSILPTEHFDMKAVNLGNKEDKSWFAPEHLHILPYQLYNRPVPDHLTKSMLRTTN